MNKADNKNGNIINIGQDGLELLQFNNLTKYEDKLIHCFTTRHGGVSENECSTLNLGLNRNDKRENVDENFKRVAKALKIDYRNMVFSNQVHDNKIKVVDEKDCGKGIIYKSDIIGYDGLVTNKRNVALVTFYADCVPVFFFDPDKEVIALSHSGWRGTVKEIAKETVSTMSEEYGSVIEDIEVVIGPSIGLCCFEVGEEVVKEFADKIDWSMDFCKNKGNGKWHIDLQGIIKRSLTNCGVRKEKILISGLCTKCNKNKFFSYRGDNGKTGSMAAVMQLI